MSGMGGIGSCGSASNQYVAAIRGNMDPSKMAGKMQEQLDSQLSDAGVSDETSEALQADLAAAIESQMSSGSVPDPVSMKETISGIFEKHGLNADDFIPQGPPGKGQMGGMPGTMEVGSSADGKADTLQILLESLAKASENNGSESDADTESSFDYNEISQQVMDIFLGIDEEA